MTSIEADAAPSSPKKTKKPTQEAENGAKKPRTPPVNQMVMAAVKKLKDRKGSSLQAIKKYIAATYKCDVNKLAVYIRKNLIRNVENGTLIQIKGSGATGSFKLSPPEKNAAEKKPAKKNTKRAASEKKTKKSASKKSAGAKNIKTSVTKKVVASKEKPTKPTKNAAKTVKTAKLKPTTTTKRAAPKKAASKK